MRARALIPGLLVLAFACGETIDTSTREIPDAGVDGSITSVSDATAEAAASADGGDDDANAKPDAATDADADMDAGMDADAGPDCPHFVEHFFESFDTEPNPNGWVKSPAATTPPYLSIATGSGDFQSSAAGTPPTPYLTRELGAGCTLKLGFVVSYAVDTGGPDNTGVVLARITLAQDTIDLRRQGGGPLVANVSGVTYPLGILAAGDTSRYIALEVSLSPPRLKVTYNGPTIDIDLKTPVELEELSLGIIEVAPPTPAGNATFHVVLDTISL